MTARPIPVDPMVSAGPHHRSLIAPMVSAMVRKLMWTAEAQTVSHVVTAEHVAMPAIVHPKVCNASIAYASHPHPRVKMVCAMARRLMWTVEVTIVHPALSCVDAVQMTIARVLCAVRMVCADPRRQCPPVKMACVMARKPMWTVEDPCAGPAERANGVVMLVIVILMNHSA